MPFTDLTPPPEAPTRSDPPDEFIVKADAFVAWIVTHAGDLTTFIGELETAAALIAAAPAYSDPGLVALTGLTPATDKGVYFTSGSASALFALTSVARTLLAQSSQANMRATGLGFTANASSLVTAADYAAMRTLLSLYTTTQVDAAVEVAQAAATAAARVPAGKYGFFAQSAAPAGWLKCNGAAVSRTTYPDLFAEIGTNHGVGDGTTTFNVPEVRGEFFRAWDDGRGIDSGRTIGSAQAESVGPVQVKLSTLTEINHDATDDGDRTISSSGTLTSGYAGGSETRPRNFSALVCIKT